MKNWLVALAICGIATTVYAEEEKTEETAQVVETTEVELSAATNETEETAINEEEGEKCVLKLCAADEVIAAEESEKEGERKLEAWPRTILG
ncbi:MAG: hypothetical protein ChlgKO_09360 [Chlamydiales bacterium]